MAQIPQIAVHNLDAAVAHGAVLLDVREDDEFAAGHIAGAVHVAMNTVPRRWQEDPDLVPDGRPVVVVCKVGGRSAQVTGWLRQRGVEAHNLDGGMLAWAHDGRPMTSDDGTAARVA